MTFVSYAQNLEDVMLWRALREVENGFYIDVGANDPDTDSVTRHFYEAGWRGINVEPLTSHWEDLMNRRPRDINLQCAAGEFKGEIDLWEPDVKGWATASQQAIAQHQRGGYAGRFHKVPVRTLAEICETHAQGVDIHFLKVDVEGFEPSVINGMDFSRFRPWVLVIEATEPNSTVENYHQWESVILANGYLFAYADGLNRFYVSREKQQLAACMKYPPNVFDSYIRSDHLEDRQRAEMAENKAIAAETQVRETQASLAEMQACLKAVQNALKEAEDRLRDVQAQAGRYSEMAAASTRELQLVYASTSWKLTKPGRWLLDRFRGGKQQR